MKPTWIAFAMVAFAACAGGPLSTPSDAPSQPSVTSSQPVV